MKRTFIQKSSELTKAEQRQELETQGYTDIAYSGRERGFYVSK